VLLPVTTIVDDAGPTVIVTGVVVVAALYIESAAMLAEMEQVPVAAVTFTSPVDPTEHAVDDPAL
jgi:hypothetical protein